MRILAVLQNLWVREPEKVRAMLARYPGREHLLLKRLLFYGGLTGKRLQKHFGVLGKPFEEIIWTEASPEIGGRSDASFPADHAHIERNIWKHQPAILLAFGRIAEGGCRQALAGWQLSNPAGEILLLAGPHPAARGVEGDQWAEMVAGIRRYDLKQTNRRT